PLAAPRAPGIWWCATRPGGRHAQALHQRERTVRAAPGGPRCRRDVWPEPAAPVALPPGRARPDVALLHLLPWGRALLPRLRGRPRAGAARPRGPALPPAPLSLAFGAALPRAGDAAGQRLPLQA